MATKTTATKTLESTSSAYLTKETRADLAARLARIEGHVGAVRKMLDENESCDDLMIQLAAVRAATTQAIVKLFEGHMETCLTFRTSRAGYLPRGRRAWQRSGVDLLFSEDGPGRFFFPPGQESLHLPIVAERPA